jgi:small GTP-binding protein
LQEMLDQAPAQERSRFNQLVEEELSRPPKIAIIGKTGVGKSSTINALFGTGLAISHTKSCTQLEEAVTVNRGSKNLIVFDMPGLLEDIDADEIHKETYARVIPQCDVAVWILDAADRAIAEDQKMLRDVVGPAKPALLDRLVIGLNKVDEVQPGRWVESANVPSRTQKESIARRIADIKQKLLKVCPLLNPERIVPYSAIRRYRLTRLRNAMEAACPAERVWVLKSRESVADYRKLVDASILDEIQRRRR